MTQIKSHVREFLLLTPAGTIYAQTCCVSTDYDMCDFLKVNLIGVSFQLFSYDLISINTQHNGMAYE